MIVNRLEIEFDVRRSFENILQGLLDAFPGGVGCDFSDFGLDLAVSAEFGPAFFTSDNGVVCRVIGDSESVVAA